MDMNEDTGDFYIMKGKKLKRGLALVLGLMLAAEVPASVATPFQMFDSYAYTGAATVKATSLNVRSGAGTGYSSVGRLAAGAAVTVIGEQRGTDGNTWKGRSREYRLCLIRLYQASGGLYQGF